MAENESPELPEPGWLLTSCPACEREPMVVLGVSEVIELVLSTVLQKGVAVLLLGSTAVVSLPWLVAAVAVAAVYIPRWLRA